MKRRLLVCIVSLGILLALQVSSRRASADSPKVDIPFGTLVRGSTCSAATHMILSPCFPYPPTLFVVFPDGKNVARYEGQNVTVRGTVDQSSCSLPLIQASRVALSKVLPDCPP